MWKTAPCDPGQTTKEGRREERKEEGGRGKKEGRREGSREQIFFFAIVAFEPYGSGVSPGGELWNPHILHMTPAMALFLVQVQSTLIEGLMDQLIESL